jgi:hypothetical protein
MAAGVDRAIRNERKAAQGYSTAYSKAADWRAHVVTDGNWSPCRARRAAAASTANTNAKSGCQQGNARGAGEDVVALMHAD